MDVAYCNRLEGDQKPNAWSRGQIADKLQAFEAMDSPWISHAQIARWLDVPRTTLEHWLQQREALRRESNLPPQVIDFFESPIGLAFLHQLIGAAHLVFVQANDCGIRNLCWFLELSRLNAFVAASYTAQQAVASQMNSLIVTMVRLCKHKYATPKKPYDKPRKTYKTATIANNKPPTPVEGSVETTIPST